eukprot:CAMPEP_0116930636 /NCGR_PEP_ID=MMETSP0467-20121206/27324_1 /TAXON_ID=283647 /ORGANISM="Mesodinium pulex, Strain SPMC105" /LENGTH=67 /DNA_ID=CAMNT_0004610893 /DNA_START=647 /DNA_END=853 /DNA_ORIENTATION=-
MDVIFKGVREREKANAIPEPVVVKVIEPERQVVVKKTMKDVIQEVVADVYDIDSKKFADFKSNSKEL